ncbi:MAG TPA: lysylphosphatidylglycerol synthase domain-containing protein, partial [Thermoanaerobaculia bacterium]|nr:lysylphosphatidylglycerol synthase domain-containing protein [Thermoanaerobaculia bacterium]
GSLAMWFVINVQIYFVLKAFALPLPLSAAYVVTAAAVLGLAVPTPGGLGSYQVAVQIALTDVFSVTRTTATSVALVAWATSFVFITLIGLGFFLFSFRTVHLRDVPGPKQSS